MGARKKRRRGVGLYLFPDVAILKGLSTALICSHATRQLQLHRYSAHVRVYDHCDSSHRIYNRDTDAMRLKKLSSHTNTVLATYKPSVSQRTLTAVTPSGHDNHNPFLFGTHSFTFLT